MRNLQKHDLPFGVRLDNLAPAAKVGIGFPPSDDNDLFSIERLSQVFMPDHPGRLCLVNWETGKLDPIVEDRWSCETNERNVSHPPWSSGVVLVVDHLPNRDQLDVRHTGAGVNLDKNG